MYYHSKHKRGFTLIEVLVVVSIIGILTAILVANYNDARKNSRDKIRKSDLKSLQLAIELYKAQNGSYPSAGCSRGAGIWTGPSASYGSCTEYIANLVPSFIPALPQNPSPTGTGYLYRTDGSSYKILILDSVESNLVTSFGDEFARCPSQTGSCTSLAAIANTYAVYSAGAEGW